LEVPKHFVSSKATIAGFSKGKYEINFFTTFSQLKPSKTKTGATYIPSPPPIQLCINLIRFHHTQEIKPYPRRQAHQTPHNNYSTD
jgi:hypothetical protein